MWEQVEHFDCKRAGFSCLEYNDRLFIVGGFTERKEGDSVVIEDSPYMLEYDLSEGGRIPQEKKSPLPHGFGVRFHAGSVNHRGKFLFFTGGFCTVQAEDPAGSAATYGPHIPHIWTYDLEQERQELRWHKVTINCGAFPDLLWRNFHQCAPHPDNPDASYLFGGRGMSGMVLGDLVYLDLARRTACPVSQHYNAPCPMPRENTSFSMLDKPSSPGGDKGGRIIPGASSGQLVLVGGRGGDGTLVPQHECIWLFSPHTNTWTCPPFQPSPRAMHSACVYRNNVWVSGGGDKRNTPLLAIQFSVNCVLGGIVSWAEYATSPDADTGRAGGGCLFFRDRLHLVGGVISNGPELDFMGTWRAPGKIDVPASTDSPSSDPPSRKRAGSDLEAPRQQRQRTSEAACGEEKQQEVPSNTASLQLEERVPAKAFRLGLGMGLTAGLGLLATAELYGRRQAEQTLRLQEIPLKAEPKDTQAAMNVRVVAGDVENGISAGLQEEVPNESGEVASGLRFNLQQSRQCHWASLGLAAALTLRLKGKEEAAIRAETKAAIQEQMLLEMGTEIANLKQAKENDSTQICELRKLLDRAQSSAEEQVQISEAQRAVAAEEAKQLRSVIAATEARLKLEVRREAEATKKRMAKQIEENKQLAETLQADVHAYKAHCTQIAYCHQQFQARRDQLEGRRNSTGKKGDANSKFGRAA